MFVVFGVLFDCLQVAWFGCGYLSYLLRYLVSFVIVLRFSGWLGIGLMFSLLFWLICVFAVRVVSCLVCLLVGLNVCLLVLELLLLVC